MGGADLLRRAMGKKHMDVMEKERKRFYIWGRPMIRRGNNKGALRNGVDEKTANKIYDLMLDFALNMPSTNPIPLPMQ